MNNTLVDKQIGGYGGLDRFRLFAAFLVVGIHTEPLISVSTDLDFLVFHVFARIAVPFFLMTTGFFVLPRYLLAPPTVGKNRDTAPLLAFLKKALVLYAVASILYLPLGIYAGYYPQGDIPRSIARNIVFDGTFYHLWYFPALIIAVLLLFALSRKLPLGIIALISVALYAFGLFGDSYYGLASQSESVKHVYDACFEVFSYTRNGIFYAPIFLVMGALAAKPIGGESEAVPRGDTSADGDARPSVKTGSRAHALIGFCISMALMLAEGMALHGLGAQRHDSMYIALIPCMFFMFRLALSFTGRPSPFLRDLSTLIFVLHPLFIVLVRGIARATGLTDILVGNSVIHYAAVCLLTLAASALLALLWAKIRARGRDKGTVRGKPALLKNNSEHRNKTARAWIELDMEGLHHNVGVLRNMLPKSCKLMPAVKANAYGHGAVEICRELNRLGVRAFCVASVDEGVELRKHRIKGEILVLGYTHPDSFHLLRRHRLIQTVIDSDYAKTLNDYGRRLAVHIKIDTGMKRLGEPAENAEEILQLYNYKNLDIQGIYTHFAADDNGNPFDREYTQRQLDSYEAVLAKIKMAGLPVPRTHVQNSFGVFGRPDLRYDYARVGIALYGAYAAPGSALEHDSDNAANDSVHTGSNEKTTAADHTEIPHTPHTPHTLHPVLSVKARVAAIKRVSPGETVGYGFAFAAERETKVAVLSIGYADGLPRALSCGAGHVLLHGSVAPIVGRICMDQTIVDITDIDGVKQGDTAVIIGKDGNKEISAIELAKHAGTIPNEILSRLGDRLER